MKDLRISTRTREALAKMMQALESARCTRESGAPSLNQALNSPLTGGRPTISPARSNHTSKVVAATPTRLSTPADKAIQSQANPTAAANQPVDLGNSHLPVAPRAISPAPRSDAIGPHRQKARNLLRESPNGA